MSPRPSPRPPRYPSVIWLECQTMEPDRIILAGGRGFLGQALAAELAQRGRQVIVLTRHPDPRTNKIRSLHWDGRTIGPWAAELDGAATIVYLTGRNVNCHHTPANRREI